jgi:alpha-glucosidase
MTRPQQLHSAPISPSRDAPAWWSNAAIYQIYIRSFADGNGDGVGDVAGIRTRLHYLDDLGIDGIWITPWYPSPMADGGYDVADYYDLDPLFGSLTEVEALIADAHALGIRLIVDIVPNHCSDQHEWFRQAVAAGSGSAERARFWFRPGLGEHGERPPNDWRSYFGGPAWTKVDDGDWYLHLFAAEQPDFNWSNPEVRAEFAKILRFWLDLGVDGFRIDVAFGLVKKDGLPDLGASPDPLDIPYADRPGVHEIWREWRQIVNTYEGDRVLVGEIFAETKERFSHYLRADELHCAFNFDFIRCEWDASRLRQVIDDTLAAHSLVAAPPTWVLSNHDVTRHLTRFGRSDTSFDYDVRPFGVPTDLELGTRRARAAALLTLALPGCVYIYQGDELGLWEVDDIPDELRQDPYWERSGHTQPGRDGCRVPLPWEPDGPSYGFSPPDATAAPWLPQPAEWKDYAASAQRRDASSMLALYRAALGIRRSEEALADDPMSWLPSSENVLAFRRGRFRCVVNLSARSIELPRHDAVLLSSGQLDQGRVPPDTTVWLRTQHGRESSLG